MEVIIRNVDSLLVYQKFVSFSFYSSLPFLRGHAYYLLIDEYYVATAGIYTICVEYTLLL